METIPVSEYPDQERIAQLVESFKLKYRGTEADAVIRVPGRVNLIGEHIDYCGYGVHPMAIQQDTLVAVSKTPNESRLVLANVNQDYSDPDNGQFDLLDGRIEINCDEGPKWWNYFLCGVKGVLEEEPCSTYPVGFKAMVDGRIPPSAGLSSSSALVVSAALATLYAQGKAMKLEDLASLCAKSERHIGTQGGGMDQAIEILAKKGSAKLIEFGPLRSTDVTLPPGAKFVIANSFELYKRAFHVYSEAKRVYDFKHVCDKADGSGENQAECEGGSKNGEALMKLGKLMYESHDSCAKNYDCSHPALDQMVQLSNMYGALGARLTGAGWGGCIVALVPEETVKDYIDGLKSKYYANQTNYSVISQDLEKLIFPTEPGSGAQIFRL